MNDEKTISDDKGSKSAPQVKAKTKIKAKSKPKQNGDHSVGLGTVLACSAAAAVLGISGGAYFGGLAGQSSQPAIVDYSQDFDTVNKSVGTLTAKLERIERQVTDLESQAPAEQSDLPDTTELETRVANLEEGENSPLDLSDLTSRLEMLEQAAFEPKSLEGLSNIQSRLKALETSANSQADESVTDAVDWETSLGTLETDISDRISALETAEMPDIPVIDLSPIEARLDQLESRVKSIPVALPPFPREAVLQVLETAKTSENKGWLSRTFGDQVVVQDADLLARLDRIETNIARQDIKAIEQDIASLPEPAQKALEPWLTQVKKTGNTP